MKPVTLDHFSEYLFPRMLRSNGENLVSFLTKKADIENNKYLTDLWLSNGNTTQRLTFSGNVQAAWWKNTQTLIFSRLQNSDDITLVQKGIPLTVLHSLVIGKTGEAKEFLRLPYSIADLAFLPDGRFVFLAEFDPKVEKILSEVDHNTDKAVALLARENVCEVLTQMPFWENGAGFSSQKRQRLYLYDNGIITPLVDEFTNVEQFQLSPDGSFAFYTAERFTTKSNLTNNLYKVDLSSLLSTDISIETPFSHSAFAVVSDDLLVVFGTNMQNYGINENGSFYSFHLPTHTITLLYDGHEYDGWDAIGSDLKMPYAPQWFAVENTVYWVSQKGDSSHVFSIHAETGAIEVVSSNAGCVSEIAPLEDSIVFTAMRNLQGPELYRSFFDDPFERQVTHLNDAAADFCFSQPSLLTFQNNENNTLHGWVMKPTEFEEDEVYPTILVIHGGPKTAYSHVLMHEMQYWANQGYGVIFCNPTGSSGHGDDFGDLRERYGLVDFDDFMLFVDTALVQNSWIDETALGVTGGSYGGYMVNWMIGHTDRFRAAVSERSISNWATLQTISDIGYLFVPDQIGTDIWSDYESVWDQSPLKFANNVSTPTLFIHSDEDYRCPAAEGLQMYSALQYFNVETKLCLFKNENHDLTRTGHPWSRIRRLDEITKWFDKHLKF